ncbi:MAG: SulP family inorganic anion transporter [Myxococcota bacterium]|nr:SulP family inorganic anion transporter [Myxococcota bacterium]
MQEERLGASQVDQAQTTDSSEPPSELADLGPQDAGYLANLKHDLPASVVVFLVALPLCLGIAVASGAPPLAGLITGIVGGIVVAWASGSHLAVSGPAAGLTAIVLAAIDTLGYQGFLLAVVISGAMQFGFGVLRAGVFAYYFPSSVIKGMLAAIGIILIMKQLPHAVGLDTASFEGDLTLLRDGQMGPIEALTFSFTHMHFGAALITLIGLVVLVAWAQIGFLKKLKWLPGPLVAVGLGIGLNALFGGALPDMFLAGEHLVSLPSGGFDALFAEMSFPDFGRIGETDVWVVAFTLAAVASIETLLCIEAIDKLDPYKRSTPTNRELSAQGIGNIIAGLIGGLPMTAVIVRGSANIHSGARTRVSAFAHGILLLLGLLLLSGVLNMIPLAALAAVLLFVGFKLANPTLFMAMFRQSVEQWAPFVITVVAILFTDLLKGVGIGMLVAMFFILRANLKTPYFIHHREVHEQTGRNHIRIELSENVSFLNKASVNRVLHELPTGSSVEIDARHSQYIHPDVLELIHEFQATAHTRKIEVDLIDVPAAPGAVGAH